MPISINQSFTAYAKSLEGTSLSKYSSLSSRLYRSRASSGNAAMESLPKSGKAVDSGAGDVPVRSNAANPNAGKKVVTRNSEVFYNNYILKTSSDKSYVIDGVEFRPEEIDDVRSVVQNAVSPLLGGKLYYDYKDYAQMGIAENSVAKYAAENLTKEQARVVNQSLAGYLSNLLYQQENWLNSECSIDSTEGVGDTGKMNTYYGFRISIPQQLQDALDAAIATAIAKLDARNAAIAKFNLHGRTADSKTDSSTESNHKSAKGATGVIYCASNKELAENIRSLFAKANIMDAGQLEKTFNQYKNMLEPAYQAIGFGRTTNERLREDTNSFTKQISDMKAIFSGIHRNRVDAML